MRLTAFLLLLSLSGCAAIFNDTRETVTFDSNPRGAQVSVNGVPIGATPVAAELTNEDDHQIQVSAPGYQPVTAFLTSSLGAGWLILDIFLGGLVGIIVDAATGSWYELDADSLFFNLVPLQGGKAEEASPAGPVS